MKKFAVYTAIIGGYDTILQPLVVDDRFDYILFSDRIEAVRIGVWQVRRVVYKNDIQVKVARYIKTHPHTLLAEYEASLWIDATVMIKSQYVYQRVVDLFAQKVSVASHIHPERDCIYDEMFAVLDCKYETEATLLDWGRVLRKHNYPTHNGLCETRVMYRVNNETIRGLNEQWWSYIEKYSRRDQLSFNYVLTELQIPFTSFLPDGVSVRDSAYFQIASHANEKAKSYAISPDSWLMKYYRKHPMAQITIKNVYFRIYSTHHPPFWAKFWGQVFRIKDILTRYKRSLLF